MNTIKKYSFGSIEINEENFSNDLILFSDLIIPNWWRKEGHFLHITDLNDVLKRKPDILVIGNGYHGRMEVPSHLVNQLEEMGIKTIVEESQKAVRIYNELTTKKQEIAGVFHLTC